LKTTALQQLIYKHDCRFTISAYVCSYVCDLDLDLDFNLNFEDLTTSLLIGSRI